jgi:hypothetical protein
MVFNTIKDFFSEGGQSANIGDDSSDDGPLPAVLHKDRTPSPLSHTRDIGDDSSDDGPLPAVLRNEESSSPTSHNANSQDSDSITAKTHSAPEKDLKNFSKCKSNAAVDGNVTPAEVMQCFHQGV